MNDTSRTTKIKFTIAALALALLGVALRFWLPHSEWALAAAMFGLAAGTLLIFSPGALQLIAFIVALPTGIALGNRFGHAIAFALSWVVVAMLCKSYIVLRQRRADKENISVPHELPPTA